MDGFRVYGPLHLLHMSPHLIQCPKCEPHPPNRLHPSPALLSVPMGCSPSPLLPRPPLSPDGMQSFTHPPPPSPLSPDGMHLAASGSRLSAGFRSSPPGVTTRSRSGTAGGRKTPPCSHIRRTTQGSPCPTGSLAAEAPGLRRGGRKGMAAARAGSYPTLLPTPGRRRGSAGERTISGERRLANQSFGGVALFTIFWSV